VSSKAPASRRSPAHSLRYRYRVAVTRAFDLFVAYGRHPFAVLPFALLAAADSLLPVMPAEFMAIGLMVLQPQRAFLVAGAFLAAAAASAFLFALLLVQLGASELAAHPALGAPGVDQAVEMVRRFGAPAIAGAAIFPDSPRTTVAVASVAGIPPWEIGMMVLIGKCALYGSMLWALKVLPAWVARGRPRTRGALRDRAWRGARRFVALQRLLERRTVAPASFRPQAVDRVA